jgi:hypothetical protein
LPNEVFSPSHGTDTYNRLNNARWSDTTILSPGCIFQPKSTKDVSRGLKVLANKKCQFAIKSGGHNPNPGANNINGGVSIDLGLLNQISLAADRSYVSLGAGSTWGAAYDKFTGEEGLLFPGGLCGTTGVGGVSLGGGQSYLLPKLGWVVDSVLNYEVVLASGDIVNANQKSHPSLFKALKGGGSNFGIVTRADVATFEQTDIWAGQVITPALPTTVEAALQATTNFTELANSHPNSGAQVVLTYTNGSAIIISSVASNDGTVNPEPLQAFTALQPQLGNTVSLRSMSNVVKELDSNQASGYRYAFFVFSQTVDIFTPCVNLISGTPPQQSPSSMTTQPSQPSKTSPPPSTPTSNPRSPTWISSSSLSPCPRSPRPTRQPEAATPWDCQTAQKT